MDHLHSIAAPYPTRTAHRASARHLYAALLGEHGKVPGEIDEVTRSTSAAFLRSCLEETERVDCDIPSDPRMLPAWLEQSHEASATAFREYLDARQAGAPRRFFLDRSHALSFLRAVAPTKLVDGAWLYGLLRRSGDARLSPLIRIYLEELGDGIAARNHVVLYRALLAANDCGAWQQGLGDEHYTQGAIQLSLAHHAADLLPEVIGFNLGYEQLPLHLPITAYELNELDIDPQYFSVHVTIDNASTGHARKALQSALDAMPAFGDRDAFYRRMVRGFKLNSIGMGTTEAIESFDLDRELVRVLADKARVGAQLHSDYCRIGGRSVSEWLSAPDGMADFLSALVAAGWIRRGAPPAESRFWRVLHDDRGPMLGVFDGYESQLLSDWITGGTQALARPGPRNPNRFRRDAGDASEARHRHPRRAARVADVVDRHLAAIDELERTDDDVSVLADRLSGIDDRDEALERLRGFLSPANHASTAGLLATRMYATILAQ